MPWAIWFLKNIGFDISVIKSNKYCKFFTAFVFEHVSWGTESAGREKIMSLASWGLIESMNYEEINNNHLVNRLTVPWHREA